MGLFFDTAPLAKRKSTQLRALPPIPETGWRPPAEFPNLSGATWLGIDCETYDPELIERGPGWARGVGEIVGVSIAAQDDYGNRGRWYFPVRHRIESHLNLPAENVFNFLRYHLHTPHIPKVGANLLYDIGWLTEENIFVEGPLYDVQFAEALLDDNAEVKLERLARKYLNAGKETDLLYEWLAEAYGGKATDAQRANLYRSPPQLAGPYAEADASHPLDILPYQWSAMERDGLLPVFHMECELIPLLIRMRRQGVRIDLSYAEQLYDELARDIPQLYDKLADLSGVRIGSVHSAEELSRVCDAVGIRYTRTATGKPSFQKAWLKEQTNPITDLINEIREYEKVQGTFVKSYLLESHVNGFIYTQFHPLRSDEGGTITGRFSSSTPNLQNIPVRSALGKRVRKAFVPHSGCIGWQKIDYSQIEYRALAHHAVDGILPPNLQVIIDFWDGIYSEWGGLGFADALRRSYNDDPNTDYHVIVQDNVKARTGKLIERRPIKNINFGLLYGQSEKALAYTAGFKPDEAKDLFAAYHEGAPYVKPTMAAVGREVQELGFIRTILGRRVRFDLWEPRGYEQRGVPLPYDQALRTYGSQIMRAYAYRGVNYKLQGTGTGDVIKAGMLKAYKSGVFEVIGVPLLQVHDELDLNVWDDTAETREGFRELYHCLETGVQMRVPIRADYSTAENWGAVKD